MPLRGCTCPPWPPVKTLCGSPKLGRCFLPYQPNVGRSQTDSTTHVVSGSPKWGGIKVHWGSGGGWGSYMQTPLEGRGAMLEAEQPALYIREE